MSCRTVSGGECSSVTASGRVASRCRLHQSWNVSNCLRLHWIVSCDSDYERGAPASEERAPASLPERTRWIASAAGPNAFAWLARTVQGGQARAVEITGQKPVTRPNRGAL